MASRKTKRRLLHKRWKRRVVKRVTDRLLGRPEPPPPDPFLGGSQTTSPIQFGINLYASQPRMSAVVYGISGV